MKLNKLVLPLIGILTTASVISTRKASNEDAFSAKDAFLPTETRYLAPSDTAYLMQYAIGNGYATDRGSYVEFVPNNQYTIQLLLLIWQANFDFAFPTSPSTIMENFGENLGGRTYTSNQYTMNIRVAQRESLNYRIYHNPSIANTIVGITNGLSTSASIGFGFGVFFEGSWAVSAEFETNFNITYTETESYNKFENIDFNARNYPAGIYDIMIDYCWCNKFFFQFNSNNTISKVGIYGKCPLPNVQYSVVKVGDID